MTDIADVQIELLVPSEVEAALALQSVVYVPLGTYEWHGQHLPIGLDALTAHGICCAAARRDGGLVCPPLYYGTGGGHGEYPWTIMIEPQLLMALLRATLTRLANFEVQTVVLMSGHFAGEQIEAIELLAKEAKTAWPAMGVKALAVSMAQLDLAPDHAALFETTLLAALWPDRVKLHLLPPLERAPSIDPGGNEVGPQRHDPDHPLYGIFGPDPRRYDPAQAAGLLDAMVGWVIDQVRR